MFEAMPKLLFAAAWGRKKAAAGNIEDEEGQPQADVAIKRDECKVGGKVTACCKQHGDADRLGVERTIEYAVVDDTECTDKREEGYKQIVLLRRGNNAVQIGEAAKNGVTAAIIADSLQQAEADGPDKADPQRIIEHGAVVLSEGNAGIDGTCLRKAGQNIAHNELYLEKNRISGQKLTAEG